MLLTFSRDVTFACSDPNGHFIGLIAEGAGELHPVFDSHRDQPFLIQNAQQLCFLVVRREDREHLLAIFITSSDTKGSTVCCVECTEEGTVFHELNVEVHGDHPRRAGSQMVSIGSKKSRLNSSVNVLVLSTESEIAIFAARMKQSEMKTLQLFLCCVIPVDISHSFALSNLYFFLQKDQEMRVYKLQELVLAAERSKTTLETINVSHGKVSIEVKRVKTMNVCSDRTGIILDSNGCLYLFQITSAATLTLCIIPIKIPFGAVEVATCSLTDKTKTTGKCAFITHKEYDVFLDHFLVSTDQGAVYVMQLSVKEQYVEEEVEAKGITCFATNVHVNGLCWLGENAFLVNASNKLLLYTL